MKLYYSKGACSLSPHIVLEELQIPFELEAVNLRAQSPEFLKINPLGAVPTLLTDKNEVLTEGPAIVQYLADLKPEAALAPPAGTWERYKLQEHLNFISSEIHKGFGLIFGSARISSDPKIQEEVKTYAKSNLAKRFDILSQKIGNSPYLMGANFSVADAYLTTVLSWTARTGIDLSKWSTLKNYTERVRARPGVQRAMKAEGLL